MRTRTEEGRSLVANLGLAIAIASLTLLVVIDLATDARGGTSGFHVVVEGAVVVIGSVASLRFALGVRRLAREARDLREHAGALTQNLEASRLEASRWRREAGNLIEGLGAAIDRQFEAWGLSPAEQEIARLLLKGLSHKEIAQLRDVSETTVRQQAQATYRKAGLSGRSDLAAFFLEDLLAPRPSNRSVV
ncbi:MAG TPA: LuxR C-terminal-related transcriptional regulator [Kofleriaceae bacterium]|nr:LuxR C-terminal-related transcriptional regulator [Kofleriaceae bacterium]